MRFFKHILLFSRSVRQDPKAMLKVFSFRAWQQLLAPKKESKKQGRRTKSRYKQLTDLIAHVKPRTIVETGTWNGDRAIEMATEALKYQKDVRYLGFDLFDGATAETDSRELNVKRHFTQSEVAKKLESFKSDNPGFDYTLVKGDTRVTLEEIAADFAFIDGGHSIETVRNDFEKLRGSKVIVLDDYYEPDEDGKCPDTSIFGCNEVVKDVDHVVLGISDPVKDGGRVKMAAVGIEAGGKVNLKVQDPT